MTTTTPDQTPVGTEIRCTADHSHILHGYAGGSDAPGSIGAFLATLPVGTEILSVSGWVCRWTGAYVDSNGHKAAVLERVRNIMDGRTGDGVALIHTCLVNVWSHTGTYSFADGAVVRMRHDRGTITPRCTTHGVVGMCRRFANRENREAAYAEAEQHVRMWH